MAIYEPAGKAREYSPLALNLYSGCDHGCDYCYVPNIFTRNRNYNHGAVSITKGIATIEADCKKHQDSPKQVLLSFTTDPYNGKEPGQRITRQALIMLERYNIPVAILTKGGRRCLLDLDIFKFFGENIKVGATLTHDNDKDSLKNEPGAAPHSERISALEELYKAGIKTWVSLEPVISATQTLNIIKETHKYVNHYKVGKLNHVSNNTDWHKFLVDSVNLLRGLGKKFYVKKDLALFAGQFRLTETETNPEILFLKNSRYNRNTLFD
jgi:DNA repair photolyase